MGRERDQIMKNTTYTYTYPEQLQTHGQVQMHASIRPSLSAGTCPWVGKNPPGSGGIAKTHPPQ